MPYSKDLDHYPEVCHTILNHAYLYGTASVPAVERSPHTLRLYFHSFRRAVKLALESAGPGAAAALRSALTRYQQLTFTIQKDPPALLIVRRDTSVLGRLLEETASDLRREQISPASIITAEALGRSAVAAATPPPEPADMDAVIQQLFSAEQAKLPEA